MEFFIRTSSFKFNSGIETYFLFQKQSKGLVELSKSIIVPAKNEEKNSNHIKRIPQFENVEILIVCGKSEDNTLEESNIDESISRANIRVLEQREMVKEMLYLKQ